MINSIYSNLNGNPQRQIYGKVELYNGSTLLDTFKTEKNTRLQEITVSRASEHGKFFGFGICQHAVVKIIDKTCKLQVNKGYRLKTAFSANNTPDTFISACPSFYVKEAHRDEKTSVITITSYDAIDAATSFVFADLGMQAPYTIKDVVEASARFLGVSVNINDPAFNTSYEMGANFGGDENLRAVLNAVAEVTQTIYFINNQDQLVFRRLDKTGNPVLTISKNDYFELTTALPVTITNIVSVTELGENHEGTDHSGVKQFVRDNPFWNALPGTEVAALLNASISRITGLTIVPYSIKWRGNFATELGDKISVEARDGSYATTYILDDTFTYTGGFAQSNSWEYNPDSEKSAATNPITLGERLNQTFAKVDKVNRTVTLYASAIEETQQSVSELQVNTQGINATVNSVEQKVTDLDDEIDKVSNQANSRIDTLSSEVALKLDKTGVEITVDRKLEEGIDKVTTASKKYTFDDEGLNISAPDSEFSTEVTDNGLRIYKSSSEVLTVNNRGVQAADLHARTFLIIGENSRLEDRGNRTACFWIGKAGG
jgi:hypothetical protein